MNPKLYLIVAGALIAIATAGTSVAASDERASNYAQQPPPSAPGPAAVTNWNQIAVNTLVNLPGPAGGAPPAAQINLAMTQGAVYDAVNAIEPKHHHPYLLTRRFAATASKEAAVATAAYTVLSDIVSTVPATILFPANASVLQSLASQYADTLGAIQDSPFKAQGVAAGEAATEAMIAAREGGLGRLSGCRALRPATRSRSSTRRPGSPSSTRRRGPGASSRSSCRARRSSELRGRTRSRAPPGRRN